MEDGSSLSLESVPAQVREALVRIEKAQQQGAETIGSADEAFTRRYVLDEHQITYFPELARPVQATTVVIIVLAVLAFAGVLAGIIRIAADDKWAPAYLAGGAVFGWGMMRLMGRDTRRTLARRDGIERVGVYLLPSVLVIREPEACQMIAREHIERFEYVPRSGSESAVKVYVNVVYRDAGDTLHTTRLATGTQLEPLLELFDQWLAQPTHNAA